MFVADGAGSAVCSGVGADLAVEVATNLVRREWQRSESFVLHQEFASACLALIREQISELADREGRVVRDYACTFLGVVATPTAALMMQLGDGGIVVDLGIGLEVPLVPPVAEYVNMTHFVTDQDAAERLQVSLRGGLARSVAIFSDGLQRLALNVASNCPYVPFFFPFFRTLAGVTVEQEDQLHEELVRFLGSAPVNDRTDDDKTLALAQWLDQSTL